MARPHTYFIVDDDKDDQKFLMDALLENDSNAQCFTATDGWEAINNLENGIIPMPDIIFLDINMPKLDGMQCLAELKWKPALRQIPVIIYSTTDNQQEKEQLLQMGAYHFMVKKSDFKALREELSKVI